MNGPPLVVYGALRRWSAQHFRASWEPLLRTPVAGVASLMLAAGIARWISLPFAAGSPRVLRFRGRGLVVLGFPSNDFGAQEPANEQEIKSFCSTRYKVTFPMFAKVATKGPDQSPVYKFLTSKHEPPRWNFHKFLIGKDGEVIRAFGHRVPPEDRELRAAIDAALG